MLKSRRTFCKQGAAGALSLATLPFFGGCHRRSGDEIVVYCGVDEPYASKIFADFEDQTGMRIAAQYDIESSKSVGLAGKATAEKDNPRADVWWGSEAFLSVRLVNDGILAPYRSPAAADIPAEFKDADGYWAGIGLRARVLAVGVDKKKPDFEITGIHDLADPRLKDKCCLSIPTAGATGAHMAALYVNWGQDAARAFLHKLYDNKVQLLGGNAEVAQNVGDGTFMLGLTDSDDISDAIRRGGKETMVIPDQAGEGTLAMPTTVGLVKGASHVEGAKKLIDFLLSKRSEQKLIDLHFARWSVRSGTGNSIKAMKIDYQKAAEVYAQAQQEAIKILQGRPLP
ncbi:MAG TPA: extracellular solute-binding protein [Tepidisphaeraceae bacterium]|jgi:iron(III) transport system substrate-binding protein|nr:extracellular solute-binding protein [Tepidisphaeraceae bacterium]